MAGPQTGPKLKIVQVLQAGPGRKNKLRAGPKNLGVLISLHGMYKQRIIFPPPLVEKKTIRINCIVHIFIVHCTVYTSGVAGGGSFPPPETPEQLQRMGNNPCLSQQ